jgi:hypothetical protein
MVETPFRSLLRALKPVPAVSSFAVYQCYD